MARRGAKASTGTKLVIVESPAKAKTIGGYLGSGYTVEASIGHIRDLPRNAADVPAKYKGEPWARLGVDTEHDFEPLYVVSPDRKQQVSKLKALVKDADELYLATDEDREGEAIAWHLVQTLTPRIPVRRMVFHEITPQAIASAVSSPRDIDDRLVDAQETRRILDRLYGYEVSPVLWKKVLPRLSAGRVQSVATRIVVERERARMAFHSADYWDVTGTFAPERRKDGDPETFTATLVSRRRRPSGNESGLRPGDRESSGRRRALGRTRSPGPGGPPRRPAVRGAAGRGEAVSASAVPAVHDVDAAAGSWPQAALVVARSPCESRSGCTRTASSPTCARTRRRCPTLRSPPRGRRPASCTATRTFQRSRAPTPAEVKNAQEAHEAIRPSGDTFRTPGQLAGHLSSEEFRLYELIWQRTLASQMADAVGTTVSVRLAGTSVTDERAEFATSGRTITFPGFLRAYVEDVDESAEKDDAEKRIPHLERRQAVTAREFRADGHTTSPPARYTEASLVKALEELGIGRPSTYASILQTIQDRGYVWKKGAALVPSWTAFAVIGLLESYFGRLVDYGFTASVENDLDAIANGTTSRIDWLRRFYFGANGAVSDPRRISAQGGLKRLIAERLEEIDARGVNSIPIGDGDAVVRVGRYGPYLQRGEERVSIPDDLPPDELTPEKVDELLSAPSSDRVLGIDDTGAEITAKSGRYGPYVTDGERTASLFSVDVAGDGDTGRRAAAAHSAAGAGRARR